MGTLGSATKAALVLPRDVVSVASLGPKNDMSLKKEHCPEVIVLAGGRRMGAVGVSSVTPPVASCRTLPMFRKWGRVPSGLVSLGAPGVRLLGSVLPEGFSSCARATGVKSLRGVVIS